MLISFAIPKEANPNLLDVGIKISKQKNTLFQMKKKTFFL